MRMGYPYGKQEKKKKEEERKKKKKETFPPQREESWEIDKEIAWKYENKNKKLEGYGSKDTNVKLAMLESKR